MAQNKLVWSIAIDSKDLDKGLKGASKKVDKFGKDVSKKDVKVDVKPNIAGLKDVTAKISKINGSKINVSTNVNTAPVKDADSQISKLNGRKANVDVNVDTAKLDDAESRISKLGSSIKEKLGFGDGGSNTFIGGPGKLLGGLAAGGIFAGLVKGSADLDENIRKIATLLPTLKPTSIDTLRKSVISLSKEIGVSTQEVSDAIYNALGSGIPENNVFDFVKTASKTAIAGATDLESVTAVLTGTVNAYASMNLTAADASDIFTQAVNVGVFTMKDLVANMSDVTPIASAMNIPLADAAGWLAKLTKNGIPVAQASTAVKQAMNELSDSTSTAGKNFKEISKKTFAEFIKKGGKIEDAIYLMDKAAKKNGKTIGEMFGSIQAKQAVLPVVGANFKDFADTLDSVRNSAGATDKAYATMDEGIKRKLSRTWQLLKGQLNDLLKSITPGILYATELATGLLQVLFTGNFNKELFGGKLNENSGIIKFLRGVRDKAKDAKDAIAQLITGDIVPGALGSKKPSAVSNKSAAGKAENRIAIAPPPSSTQKSLEDLRNVLEDIVGFLKEMGDFFVSTFGTMQKVLEPVVNFILTIVRPAFNYIKDSLKSIGINAGVLKFAFVALMVVAFIPLIAILSAFVAGMYIVAAVLGVVRTAVNAIKLVFGAFATSVKFVADRFSDLLDFLKAIPREIKKVSGAIGDFFKGKLGKALGGAWGVPGRAAGGSVRGGKPYIVGEIGPELYVPEGNGRIMTASQTSSLLANKNSGGATVGQASTQVSLKIDVSGVTAMSRPQAKQFGSMVIDAVNDDLRKRGVDLIGGGFVKGGS